MTHILFIGETWFGSCARSLKEALNHCQAVTLEEVGEDHFIPKPRARWLRAVNRILLPAYRRELEEQVLSRLHRLQPQVLVAYKGTHLTEAFIRHCNKLGYLTVNVYPDCSPHAHSAEHQRAVGAYKLVISTKPFHPALWTSTYGYSNKCVFVPQGYDPNLHLVSAPPTAPRFDIVLVATWRPEYGELLKRLANLLAGKGVTVGIGGNGWMQHRNEFPADWAFVGELQGRAYIDWLRQGKICLAPITRNVDINNVMQPGDEDTTRTYELAAAHCFFIHRRTSFAKLLYDEQTEVPMFDSVEELAEKILFYLPNVNMRTEMAAAAHARAVPRYSIVSRAGEILGHINSTLQTAPYGR
jgi:hypothetical protein